LDFLTNIAELFFSLSLFKSSPMYYNRRTRYVGVSSRILLWPMNDRRTFIHNLVYNEENFMKSQRR